MNVVRLSPAADLLLLYPGESLQDQIRTWGARRPRRRVKISSESSLPAIRKLLRTAETAIVDAGDDPCRASDAFLQAVARLGAEAVAVYSEATHEGLESFVRQHGSLFILGPLFARQWADFFQRFLEREGVRPTASAPRQAGLPLPLRLDRAAMFRRWFARRCRGNLEPPVTGLN
ncbi:MAG: hypothetical protein JW959_07695 [Pirellulales bacterium]|nr:hypothetical protein [Pirellulales bacterium]